MAALINPQIKMSQLFGPDKPDLGYLQEGQRLIVLFSGGDKASQDRDIEQAHRIAEE
jgi:hypothetical protein